MNKKVIYIFTRSLLRCQESSARLEGDVPIYTQRIKQLHDYFQADCGESVIAV